MQQLNLDLIKRVKRQKIKKLEEGLVIASNTERVECPFCHYTSKKNKFSGMVFVNSNSRTFKCFSCGIWRRLE